MERFRNLGALREQLADGWSREGLPEPNLSPEMAGNFESVTDYQRLSNAVWKRTSREGRPRSYSPDREACQVIRPAIREWAY